MVIHVECSDGTEQILGSTDATPKIYILNKRRVQSKVKVLNGDSAAFPHDISFNAFSSCLALQVRDILLFLLFCRQVELQRVCDSLPG